MQGTAGGSFVGGGGWCVAKSSGKAGFFLLGLALPNSSVRDFSKCQSTHFQITRATPVIT